MSPRSFAFLSHLVLLSAAWSGCLERAAIVPQMGLGDVRFTLEADRASAPMGSNVTFFLNATNNGLTTIHLVGGGCDRSHLRMTTVIDGEALKDTALLLCTADVQYHPIEPRATLTHSFTWEMRLYRRDYDTVGQPALPGNYTFTADWSFEAFEPGIVPDPLQRRLALQSSITIQVEPLSWDMLADEPLRLRYGAVADPAVVAQGNGTTFRVTVTNEGNHTAWYDTAPCFGHSWERSLIMEGPTGGVRHIPDISCASPHDRFYTAVPPSETRSWNYTWDLTQYPYDREPGKVPPGNYTLLVRELFFTKGPHRFGDAAQWRRFEATATVRVLPS